MIYTITFNPSLDYLVFLPNINLGNVNRTTQEIIFPGGKGINVALVLENLGFRSNALGFIAGYTGKSLIEMLNGKISKLDFITLEQGQSRINVKIKAKEETDLNAQGPIVSKENFQKLLEKLDKLTEGDILVLSGAISKGLDNNTYKEILARLQNKNILTIVDATNDLLKNSLTYKPFLVKPNILELATMFKVEIKTKEDIIFYAKKTQELGARNVLVSLGADGALLLTEKGNILTQNATKLTSPIINSVGAGDSMVAGFIAGWQQTKDYQKALNLAVACGGACVMQQWLPTLQNILEIMPQAKQFLPK